jgi:hypothetical protein
VTSANATNSTLIVSATLPAFISVAEV